MVVKGNASSTPSLVLIIPQPALGFIYRDYLHAYSHWAFCDIDLLAGDLGRYLDHQELSDYDILTFSYGDQYRGYLR